MKSGIYKITNKVNGKSYIGLTNCIKTRWGHHKGMMKNGNHHSTKLRNAVAKYGMDNFTFEVLEYCNEELLSEKEIHYITLYDSFKNGYNMNPGGDKGTVGIYNGNYKDIKYTFYNIDGRIEENITCYEFVEKWGYKKNSCKIYSVALGTRDVFDGWVKDKSILNQSRKGFRYKFYHLDGTITDFLTQMEFNTKYNINNDGAVSALILGKFRQFRGWFKSQEELDEYKKEELSKLRTIINDNGEIIENISQIEFRKLTGCDSCSSSKLFNGNYSVVKGWRLLNNI
jgi:group I intron endonuclease